VLNALQVGDVGAQFKFQNHPSHFTTVRLMLRSKQLHNKNALSSHGFSCPNNNEPLDPIFYQISGASSRSLVFSHVKIYSPKSKKSTLATFSSPQELTRGIRPKRSPHNSLILHCPPPKRTAHLADKCRKLAVSGDHVTLHDHRGRLFFAQEHRKSRPSTTVAVRKNRAREITIGTVMGGPMFERAAAALLRAEPTVTPTREPIRAMACKESSGITVLRFSVQLTMQELTSIEAQCRVLCMKFLGTFSHLPGALYLENTSKLASHIVAFIFEQIEWEHVSKQPFFHPTLGSEYK